MVRKLKKVNSLNNFSYKVTSTLNVEASVEETPTDVNLLCRHFDSSTNIPCIFLSPAGTTFAPREGVPMERYAYYGNDINHDCGMSIKKPLQNSEIGFWKCMMTSPKYASILKVGGKCTIGLHWKNLSAIFLSDNKIVVNGSTKTKDISIVLSDSYQSKLTIHCFYPEPLTYCYARSPAGRIYSAITGADFEIANYTGMGLNQGDCQITIDGEHLWKNESGRWLCGMGVQGFEDVQVEIHVLISGMFLKFWTILM